MIALLPTAGDGESPPFCSIAVCADTGGFMSQQFLAAMKVSAARTNHQIQGPLPQPVHKVLPTYLSYQGAVLPVSLTFCLVFRQKDLTRILYLFILPGSTMFEEGWLWGLCLFLIERCFFLELVVPRVFTFGAVIPCTFVIKAVKHVTICVKDHFVFIHMCVYNELLRW